MVAVPQAITGTKRVRRYFKDRGAATAYVFRVRQEGFLTAEGPPGAPGKTTLGECAALWLARHEEYRPTFLQIRQARHGRDPIDAVGHRELDAWLRSLNGNGLAPVGEVPKLFLAFFPKSFFTIFPRNPLSISES